MKEGRVRGKPVGLSAKKWRETAHLRSLQGSESYSKPLKGPKPRVPQSNVWGQTAPHSREMPRPAEGLPLGGENTI